jgi:hypothetical protein
MTLMPDNTLNQLIFCRKRPFDPRGSTAIVIYILPFITAFGSRKPADPGAKRYIIS